MKTTKQTSRFLLNTKVLFLGFILFAGNLFAAAPTISGVSVNTTSICASSSATAVTVKFTPSNFTGTNTYTAYLSSSTGSFTTPTIIGTLSSSITGSQLTINAGPGNIPGGLAPSGGYKIEVKSGATASTVNPSFTINPLPVAKVANPSTICSGASATIGATAVSGDTYSWVSNPPGFTSTSSNPAVNPIASTTYTLTETVSATGCASTNTVKITVNGTAPAANTGSPATICTGVSVSIGATAVGGDTYSWVSAPSGFTSASSNPSVAPTSTTTYTLTETITATGCTNTNSVVISVNPVPPANAGTSAAVCNGVGASIGATTVAGDTYSWASNPSGFTSTVSNPSVSPAQTTTYTLNETITATGCANTNSVVITVNSLPAANAGNPSTFCSGGSAYIGSTAVSGHSYSWVSNPSGFTSTSSNPSVSPTTTTTYLLTETVTATGCTSSNSVVIAVNPLPAANAGLSQADTCFLGPVSLGSSPVAGDTYAWTSNPTGFSSAASNPTVKPAVTTTYYLTEEITATGCANSNSVTITVNQSPSSHYFHPVQRQTNCPH